MKKGKIMLNTKSERHMVGPHALSREVFTYIYIYIYIYIDFQNIEKKRVWETISIFEISLKTFFKK